MRPKSNSSVLSCSSAACGADFSSTEAAELAAVLPAAKHMMHALMPCIVVIMFVSEQGYMHM